MVTAESQAGLQARRLVEQAQEQIRDPSLRREYIEFIETILVYKLPQKSFEEIAAMLGIKDIKQTRAYQEACQEGIEIGEQRGKLEVVPILLELGLSVEQIAERLHLDLDPDYLYPRILGLIQP